MKRVKTLLPFLLAFLIPIAIFLLAFCLLPIFGATRSVLYQDPNVEFVDFLAYFKRLINGEESFFYSFNMGGGTGMIALTSFYLFSPFNLLAALFPNYLLGYIFFLIIILEIGAAGLVCYYYFRKEHTKLGVYRPLIFSCGYALSAYMLGYFEHFEWLDSIVILPLVCLGINKIVRGEKPWLYLISLAIAILTCYYSGFMICIFSVLWFIYRLFIEENKLSVKSAIKKFSLASILAGTIGMFLIIPTIFLMANSTTNRLSSEVFSLENKFPISQLFIQLTSNQAYYSPLIFGGMIITVLAILYFVNKKISTKHKLASLALAFILMASMNIMIVCAIWHLGSIERGAPYRFTFIVTFFIATLAAHALENYRHTNKEFGILALIGFVILYMLKLPDYMNSEHNAVFFLDLIIIITSGIIILRPITKNLGRNLIILQAISLFGFSLVMLVMLSSWELGVSSFTTTKNAISDTGAVVDKLEQAKQGDEFYRTEKTFLRSKNDGLQHSYHGTSSYTSTAVDTVQQTFIQNLFFSFNTVLDTANNGQITTGALPPLSSTSLTNVKYVISPNDEQLDSKYFTKITNTDLYSAYEYSLALPLGFAVDENTATITATNPKTLINQIALSELGQTVFTKLQSNAVTGELQNTTKLEHSFVKQTKSADGIIIYKINNPSKETVYFSFDFNVPEGAHPIAISEVLKKNQETGNFEHLSHLFTSSSYNLGNDEQIEIKIKFSPDELFLDNEEFYIENTEAVKKLVSKFKEQKSDWVEISNNELEGHVDINKTNQELVLSLEYDKSWQVEVDNQKIEPERAFGSLIGIKLTPGKHTIKMKYIPRGWYAGIMISTLGFLGAIAWYAIDRRKS